MYDPISLSSHLSFLSVLEDVPLILTTPQNCLESLLLSGLCFFVCLFVFWVFFFLVVLVWFGFLPTLRSHQCMPSDCVSDCICRHLKGRLCFLSVSPSPGSRSQPGEFTATSLESKGIMSQADPKKAIQEGTSQSFSDRFGPLGWGNLFKAGRKECHVPYCDHQSSPLVGKHGGVQPACWENPSRQSCKMRLNLFPASRIRTCPESGPKSSVPSGVSSQ